MGREFVSQNLEFYPEVWVHISQFRVYFSQIGLFPLISEFTLYKSDFFLSTTPPPPPHTHTQFWVVFFSGKSAFTSHNSVLFYRSCEGFFSVYKNKFLGREKKPELRSPSELRAMNSELWGKSHNCENLPLPFYLCSYVFIYFFTPWV